MKLGKFIAGLSSAVVLAAALLFAPANAQAHTGHEHGATTHTSHTQHLVKQQTSQTSEAAFTKPALQEISPRASNEPAEQGSTSNCIGSCCGNGLGCCGAAITTAQQTLPDFAHVSAIEPLAFDYSTGVDPDALKRPPRTLA